MTIKNKKKLYAYVTGAVTFMAGTGICLWAIWIAEKHEDNSVAMTVAGAMAAAGIYLFGRAQKEIFPRGEPLPKTDSDITTVEKK